MPNKSKVTKCVICKKETDVREILMSGPGGYRRYKICAKCAEKQVASRAKP